MLSIKIIEPTGGPVRLGAVIRFQVEARATATWRAHIKFENLIYPRQLASSEPAGIDPVLAAQLKGLFPASAAGHPPARIDFFPEAPGHYELQIVWHDGPSSGLATIPFAVAADRPVTRQPRQVAINKEHTVWVPGDWDASYVTRCEPHALAAAAAALRPGHTAYDIGASLGAYTLQFLRAIGPTGHAYAFELNPVCISFLLSTLETPATPNCTIIPCAITDRDGAIPCAINYGSTGLGLAQTSQHYAHKTGHDLTVPSARLDTLIATHALRKPDLIKIDVEGAEATVIAGMQDTLARHRPILLIEIHGLGAAAATLPRLDPFAYTLEDPATRRRAENSTQFLRGMTDQTFHVLCRPRA